MGDDVRTAFPKNLKRLMERDKIRQVDIVNAIGASKTTVHDWVIGKTYPRADSLQQLCVLFHCEIWELTGEVYYENERTREKAEELFHDKNMRLLFDAAKDASPEDLQMAADLLKRLKDKG